MNKLSILGLGVLLFAASCKKQDYLAPNTALNQTQASAQSNAASQWKSLSNWQSKNYDKSTVYSAKIQDSAITSSVVSSGLVLAYKKTGTTINALPFQQSVGGTTYSWFYQVVNGGIQVSCNVSGANATAPAADHSIVYFVLSSQQLSSLQAQGKTKATLMNLSYQDAQTLLKN